MKKYLPLLTLSMMISLFIYVFYRTEKTLVNQLFITCFTREYYLLVKTAITHHFPLHRYIVFTLPEGLWIFCITITSSFFYLDVRGRHYQLIIIPIIVAIMMEILQLVHILHGRFDVMDVLGATIGWALAVLYTRNDPQQAPLFATLNAKTVYCMISYCIVYLAHVL